MSYAKPLVEVARPNSLSGCRDPQTRQSTVHSQTELSALRKVKEQKLCVMFRT